MSILIENVSKKFNGKTVLDSINLEIKTGSLVALLGGSGSGKSSLLRVVAGFEEPDTGRVWLHGKNSRKISVQEKEIGFVFQAYALFQHLTVYENIAFGISVNKKNLIKNSKSSLSLSFGSKEPVSGQGNKKGVLKPASIASVKDSSRLLGLKASVLQGFNFFIYAFVKPKQVIGSIFTFLCRKPVKVNGINDSIYNASANHIEQQPKEQSYKKSNPILGESYNPLDTQNQDISSYSSATNETGETTKGKINKLGLGFASLYSIDKWRMCSPLTLIQVEQKHRVEELLRVVELEELAHRYPAQLSGGQCQRVALARALAVEPKVLLLDEPFGALDQKVRKQLRKWLRQLHEKVGVTTIFVTHDYQEAMEVANEIVVLEEGRVKYSLQQPKSFYQKINQQ